MSQWFEKYTPKSQLVKTKKNSYYWKNTYPYVPTSKNNKKKHASSAVTNPESQNLKTSTTKKL